MRKQIDALMWKELRLTLAARARDSMHYLAYSTVSEHYVHNVQLATLQNAIQHAIRNPFF